MYSPPATVKLSVPTLSSTRATSSALLPLLDVLHKVVPFSATEMLLVLVVSEPSLLMLLHLTTLPHVMTARYSLPKGADYLAKLVTTSAIGMWQFLAVLTTPLSLLKLLPLTMHIPGTNEPLLAWKQLEPSQRSHSVATSHSTPP